MAKYYNPTTRQIIDVANPKMNSQLIAGTTLIPDQSITQAEREVTLPSGKTGLQDPLGNIYQRGTNPITGLSEKQTITGESLTPSTSLNFQQPITSPPTDISGLEAPKIEATEKEEELDTFSKDLQKLTEQISGKTAFQIEKEKEFGVAGAEQTLEDLSRQLRDLQREQQAIPLKVEGEFRGRAGIGEQERISQARRREIAIEALTLSSSLDAAQGLLSSANRKVERAIREKYGALEAQREAKIANYDLILKSPETSRQDKERAAKLKLAEERLKTAETDKKKNEEAAQKKVNDIITQNQGKITATQIAELQKLPDETSVLTQAQAMGLQTTKPEVATAGSLEEFRLVMGREPKSLEELNTFTQSREAAGRKPEEDINKPLSILDVARYNELYPEANVSAGDTEVTANAKVAKINTPEAKIRNLVIGAKENNKSFQEVVKVIDEDNTIKDKELAKKIAKEVYGNEAIIPESFKAEPLGSAGQLTPQGGFISSLTNFLFK